VIRGLRAIAMLVAAIASIGAAPKPSPTTFPAASATTLANGIVVITQKSADTPLVGVQVFLPAGLSQQPTSRSGVAAVTAAVVLHTPVEGAANLSDVALRTGAAVTYTIDPDDTRFYLECKASDLPRLMQDLHSALAHPDAAKFGAARDAAIDTANAAVKDPARVAYAMIRQVQYDGTSYAHPEAGRPVALQALTSSDVDAFAAQYRHGPGTVVAMSGNVTDEALASAKSTFSDFPATTIPRSPTAAPLVRGHEVVAHRDVASPWVAIGYAAPAQFSADFPAMLVIESLLGRGVDVHAFSLGPDAAVPQEFVGGYYQYEAQPGSLVEFYNGPNVDQDLRNLQSGIGRLRGGLLPPEILDQARRSALGDFLASVATLDDQSWLLGRAAQSPSGAAYENALPVRIASVTASDVQRVARKYLSTQTVAVLLPSGAGP
jgi:zinc protease